MVDFLVDRVGNERFGATGEVRRYLQYPPLYQAAYMIGGLQLFALHREAVGSGRMTEKAFHDAVLSCHSIPIEMVRAELLDLPLARDLQPALAVRRRAPDRMPEELPLPISLEASHGLRRTPGPRWAAAWSTRTRGSAFARTRC